MFFLLPQTSRFRILENSIVPKAKAASWSPRLLGLFLPFLPEAWTATHGGQESSLVLQEQDLLWQHWAGGLARSTLPSSSSRAALSFDRLMKCRYPRVK